MSGIVVLILRILLVALLYGFLGWALVTLWRDLRAQGQLLGEPNIPALTLVPLPADEGGPAPEDQTQSFTLPEIIIGRSMNSDYTIPNETVSARHARLSYHQNQWWVQDLNSTNGTFLNDERVSVPTVIISGDELRCGQVCLTVNLEEKGRKPGTPQQLLL